MARGLDTRMRPVSRRRVARFAVGALAAATELPTSALAQRDGLDDAGAAAASPDELVIYANIEEDQSSELIQRFRSRHPRIKVRYRRQLSEQLYDRFLEDVATNRRTADLIWSSAMDLQMKL